jgi:hypothetical protein
MAHFEYRRFTLEVTKRKDNETSQQGPSVSWPAMECGSFQIRSRNIIMEVPNCNSGYRVVVVVEFCVGFRDYFQSIASVVL